jgi:predicted nucleic acid-binding protein
MGGKKTAVTVTVDINVLLDVFQKREPHYAASARILAMVEEGSVRAVFPAHGFTTLYYLIRKYASKPDAVAALDGVLRHYQIGNLDAAGWMIARNLPMDDFEDAVVAAVAQSSNSSFVITRNTGDFANSPVPAASPLEFLSQFAQL